ncbi:hypothetical protein BA899_04560 [Spiribacter sp. SSL99]|uniref:hypothetical protein n=1 Tax=Spiribacter sp. SSL99 TaxID=1866884 RepID=UPI001330DC62|nr:hypothetical protein [Spiribacter sp. SSL99]KAF0285114.1 hypothetical protein BA899_04560 [Spiribacter sp. SSL99]
MPIGVNLLPWRARQARRRRWRLALIGLGGGLAGLMALAIIATRVDQQNAADRAHQAELEAQLAELAPAIEAQGRLERTRERLDARHAVTETLGEQRRRAPDALTQTLAARPPTIALTRLRIHAEERVIEGHSRQPDALPRLIDSLRAAPAFAGFHLQRLTHLATEGGERRGFRLTLTRPSTPTVDDDG